MIGISLLLLIACWFWLGVILWLKLINPRVHNSMLKTCLTFLLATIWFVGPVLDEILGAREFDQLCREMPSSKFYGPAAVGPGVFYDDQGRARWKNGDEFSAIIRNTNGWEKIFVRRNETKTIRKWPMPITEQHTEYSEKSTGKITLESFARYSQGGWLRRLIGIGDYQCPIKGPYPKDEDWIVFSK